MEVWMGLSKSLHQACWHRQKNGWDKVKHFAHSAYHRYTKGHPAAIITRAKEFNDLVESWFGQDPEGWSDDDMVANYKGINFAAEHG
jgi:hypothetical protein